MKQQLQESTQAAKRAKEETAVAQRQVAVRDRALKTCHSEASPKQVEELREQLTHVRTSSEVAVKAAQKEAEELKKQLNAKPSGEQKERKGGEGAG